MKFKMLSLLGFIVCINVSMAGAGDELRQIKVALKDTTISKVYPNAVEIIMSGEVQTPEHSSSRIVCGYQARNYVYLNSTNQTYAIESFEDCLAILNYLRSNNNMLILDLSEKSLPLDPGIGSVMKASKYSPESSVIKF